MYNDDLQITPLSQRLASAISAEMKAKNIGPMKLERMLNGEVNVFAIRRIRRGTSGCRLRTYEKVLDALGLQLCVVPKAHPDIL